MHNKKVMSHKQKALHHMMKDHESPKMAKKHEAKAGKKVNKMKKHHKAEAKGMKKAMCGMM